MAVQVLIGDRFGKVIAEVQPEVSEVAWRLNEIARAQMIFSKKDAKATEENLQYGNRVLIKFSSDIGLPNWGGVIDLPRGWGSSKIGVSCYGIEYLLQFRITGKTRAFNSVPVGKIFSSILIETQYDDLMGITVGSIWMGGRLHSPRYHYKKLWDIIKDGLVSVESCDIQFVPQHSNGYITFQAELYERLGEDKSNRWTFKEGKNVSSAQLTEQGSIINSFTAIGAGSTWGEERVTTTAVAHGSEQKYGIRQGSEVFSNVGQQTMTDVRANYRVKTSSEPHIRPSLVVVNKSPAKYVRYHIGDSLRCILPTYGFGGYDETVRILAREYDVKAKSCSLVTEEDVDPTVSFEGVEGEDIL